MFRKGIYNAMETEALPGLFDVARASGKDLCPYALFLLQLSSNL